MSVKIDTHQIITANGQVLDFTNVDPTAINRYDLARGLANVCRYSGQVTKFYSVAEHCILVARHAPLHLKPYALLHDAAEAYIGDVPRPVKLLCPEYKEVEGRVEEAILKRFGVLVSAWELPVIKELDNRALLLEAMSLKLVTDPRAWLDVPGEPLDDEIQCWSPEEAERQWINAAELLGVI